MAKARVVLTFARRPPIASIPRSRIRRVLTNDGANPHRIEFFANASCDDSGRGAGEQFIGAMESRAGTHPRGFHTRYLAEGATSSFFDTRFAIVNTGDVAALAVFRFMKGDGTEVTHELLIGALARQTVDPKTVAGLEAAEFSTLVEANAPVIVDRTMTTSQRPGSGKPARRVARITGSLTR
jgi:hypothetical protein